MKKWFGLFIAILLTACSSGIKQQDVEIHMPDDKAKVIVEIPSTDSMSSNLIFVGLVNLGMDSNTAQNLMTALKMSNVNIGVFGKNQAINKAMTLYALNNTQNIGHNISLYMLGSASDKIDLEKAASAKQIQLHYVIKE